jgi:periplasmic protein TonB
MADQVLVPPAASSLEVNVQHRAAVPNFLPPTVEESLFQSLKENLRDFFFPEKLPPLKVTSKPVAVKNIWGDYDNRKKASTASILIHCAAIALIVALTIWGGRQVVQVEKPKVAEHIEISDYLPVAPKKPGPTMGGGGGGGDRSLIQAPKGRLPKVTLQEQITPPTMVVRNDHPKLEVEPTITLQQNIKGPALPNIGDPKSTVVGPASNGTGSGGGIGSGSGGGIGSGSGTGLGAGRGGNTGGGVFRVGNGVSAPKLIYQVDPEFSEEARKAKYQGVVILQAIIDQAGRPTNLRVVHGLGMGLDEKAKEAVAKWKFEPAQKDGHPVAVMSNIEVNFHLY